ncbi:hypothetical protein SAMN05216411_10689 [Nitrosospira multiformis]|nr:hypothetical protein SAMN05216411_10689 [Nitrosospira multiformis]
MILINFLSDPTLLNPTYQLFGITRDDEDAAVINACSSSLIRCIAPLGFQKNLVKAMKGIKLATNNQKNHSPTMPCAVDKGVEAKLLERPAADGLKRSTIGAVAHDSPKGQR